MLGSHINVFGLVFFSASFCRVNKMIQWMSSDITTSALYKLPRAIVYPSKHICIQTLRVEVFYTSCSGCRCILYSLLMWCGFSNRA